MTATVIHTLRKTGAEQTGNLLDEGLRGKESVVLLGKLLDELLVLVQLLQVVNRHVLEVDLLSTVDVGGIGENADGHARAGDMGELDGARETLVALGVVVLETNLELDGLDEGAPAIAVGLGEKPLDRAPHA